MMSEISVIRSSRGLKLSFRMEMIEKISDTKFKAGLKLSKGINISR